MKKQTSSKEHAEPSQMNERHEQLIVAHMRDGRLIRGVLEWEAGAQSHPSPERLPEVFRVHPETGDAPVEIRVADSKAIFFVRSHEGDREYEETKFSIGHAASGLWVQAQFADGEVLEGYVMNSIDWLNGSGIWMSPTDRFSNNTLIYVPRSSLVQFHVLGVTEFPKL